MKRILCIVFLAALLLTVGAVVAGAQAYGQQPGQFQPGYGQQYQQPQYQQPQYQQPQYQQPVAQPQYGQQPSALQQLNLPSAPQKPTPNRQYGNTDRAAILGEQLSRSSQGNADVYVSENPDNTVSLDVKLNRAGSPYEIAGAMANLTYMVDSIYYLTERKGNDIVLKVTDQSGTVITNAKFSDAKNAFEYYDIPKVAQQPAAPETGQQPGYGQPAYGQQPGAGVQPAYRQPSGQMPAYGPQQPSFG